VNEVSIGYYLVAAHPTPPHPTPPQETLLNGVASLARQTAAEKLAQLTRNHIDMEKSQTTYSFASQIDNGRETPFVPRVSPFKPHSVTPLTLTPLEGHGLSPTELYGHNNTSVSNNTDTVSLIAPTIHYPHPYKDEINALAFLPSQLAPPRDLKGCPNGVNNTLNPTTETTIDPRTKQISLKGCILIDTEKDLVELCKRLNRDEVEEIAVDLEAHNFRSFSGFTCLMQVSVRPSTNSKDPSASDIETCNDFLIDTLALRRSLPQLMAEVFADPSTVKVMHGADNDILWLQRDFGIYVVNLFDTGRASRLLQLPSFSLAFLLKHYAGYQADKKHQLSDWRQRPLPKAMMSYARSDTHFLLDIYDK
jgi:exosome complex exonuclease RRP6